MPDIPHMVPTSLFRGLGDAPVKGASLAANIARTGSFPFRPAPN